MSRIKEIFPEFYRDKLEKVLEDKNSNKVLFVFDTNYFLDIYRLESSTAIKFVEAIEQIKANIFIPFQVGLEFHMNRKNVIIDRKNKRDNFKDHVGKGFDRLTENINETKSLNFDEKNIFLDEITKKIDELKKELLEDINKKYNENTEGHIDIEKRIINIFEKYMGEEPSEKEEDEYLKNAKERYNNEQPPGFNDSNKKSFYYNGRMRKRKYGDLLVWKETLNYLKDKENIEYVVFVSNDGKSDKKTDIRHSIQDKNYDLHISLISEMYYENKKALYLMTNREFLEYQLNITEEEKNILDSILINNLYNEVSNLNNQVQQTLNNSLSDRIKLDLTPSIIDQSLNISNLQQAQKLIEQSINLTDVQQQVKWITDQLNGNDINREDDDEY